MPNRHLFYEWIRNQRKDWKVIFTLVAAPLQVIVPYLITFLPGGIACNALVSSIYGIQAIVIATLFLLGTPKGTHEKYPDASMAVRQFRNCWRWLWATWLLMYFIFAVRQFCPPGPYWELLFNCVNNAQTLFVILCYVVLAQPTTKNGESRLGELVPGLVVFFVILSVINVPFLPSSQQQEATKVPALQASSETLTNSGAQAPTLKQNATVPEDVSKPTVRQFFRLVKNCQSSDIISTDVSWHRLLFRMLSGLVAGIALALLVGRLESMYINPPRLVLILLYLYAVIQVMWVEFGGNQYPYIQVVVTFISLFFKLVLFLFVTYLLESYRMLFYAEHVRKLYHIINEEWLRFSEGLKSIEDRLHDKLVYVFQEATKLGGDVTRFSQALVDEGSVSTAKMMVSGDANKLSSYFSHLRDRDRLDLTVEAVLLHESFRALFSEHELTKAKIRLENAGYKAAAFM